MIFVLCACEKPVQGYTIPAPNTGNTTAGGNSSATENTGNSGTSENQGDNGNTGDNGNAGDNGNSGNNENTETGGTLCTDIGQTPMVLAYFTEYSEEMPDATKLTHINYAHGRFGNPTTGDGGIKITESKKAPLKSVVALKSVNPKLKVMLMIGGWGSHADGFSMMARDASKRTAFCKAVKAHIDSYGLDGVDLDWEYPTYAAEGNGASPDDKANFILVLKELRETIGTSKIISFASSSSAEYMDWTEAIKYIDYVNVMTYDMGRPPERHNSPLYRSSRFSQTSCDESINKHVAKGIPLDRMNLGVPFYGKSDKSDDTYADNVKYNEMAEILEKGTYKGVDVSGKNIRGWDSTAKVPFLSDAAGKVYLSYDDPESVGEKGKYVLSKGLAGAMFWEYRHDSSDHALLTALVNAIYGSNTVIQ